MTQADWLVLAVQSEGLGLKQAASRIFIKPLNPSLPTVLETSQCQFPFGLLDDMHLSYIFYADMYVIFLIYFFTNESFIKTKCQNHCINTESGQRPS